MDNNHAGKPGEKRYLFDKPENVKRLLRGFYAICVLLVVLDFAIHRHIYHSWENMPVFYAIYGFIGCVVLVLVAKWMRTFLMRSEDYYDREELETFNKDETQHVDH